MAKDKARTNDDAAQAATTEAANETYFSIPNAAAELGIEKQRLRALIRQEKIKSTTRDMEGVEGVTVEVIAGSEIERYKEARGNRGSSGKQGERKEGKLWVIRLTKEQHDAYLAGTLDTTTVPLEPRYTAQNKSKKKAADALTAEATAGASEGATDLPPGATHAEDDVWNASGDQSDETPSGDDIVYED
jgi:hypothetical protein